VEQNFSKTHFDASQSAKNNVTKVDNFDKNCITLSKENQESPFKHIRFGRSTSPVKVKKKTCFKISHFFFSNFTNV
jgi:hypothetical protein